MIPVKYIGKRSHYTDGCYGTHIIWQQGQTQLVPDDKAAQLLRHPDVYVRGKSAGADVALIPPKTVETETDSNLQDARDLIASMDKDALDNYAKVNYRINIDKRQTIENMRLAVTGLVDQYGIA